MSDEIQEIHMPKLGESVAEGTIGDWLKKVGDTVAFDEPLFLIESDKIVTEFPSPAEGVLLEIVVPAGETAPIGTVVARIGPAGAKAGGKPQAAVPAQPAATPAVTAAAPVAARSTPPARRGGQPLSPLVRRLAAEHHVDLSQISGSGAGGRIMREDVQAAIAKQPRGSARTATAATTAAAAVAPPPVSAHGRDDVVPLSRVRLITAQRMVESRRISPHVWTSVEVDLENVARLRAQHKDRFRRETGAGLTFLPFIMRAVCEALRAFPAVNASIDVERKTMTLHGAVHLGIAVDLDEKGLLAPVIRNADALTVRGLAEALTRVANAAKQGTLQAGDLQGSTFTITNPGPLGSYASAPIINQPNVAILATDGVARRPAVVGDGIAIRHMGILGFSYDHRAFDGVTAARFLDRVRKSLQEWSWDGEIG